MSKILGSWSGMRRYLEEEMLSESLRGRVRYDCTTYVGMDGCHVFSLYIDDRLVKRFSWETVNSWFLEQGYKELGDPWGTMEYWAGFWKTLDRVPMGERTEYTDGEFCGALRAYRNQSIDESLASEDPIVNLFAVLDRRVGKRRLAALKEAMERPEWLREVLELRLDAEGTVRG